jgi:hypothetical protein
VFLRLPAVFSSSVGEDPDNAHPLFLHKRQDPVVKKICRSNRGLRAVQLGGSPLGVGVYEGLL